MRRRRKREEGEVGKGQNQENEYGQHSYQFRLSDHDTHLVALLLCLSGLMSPLGCVGLDFVKISKRSVPYSLRTKKMRWSQVQNNPPNSQGEEALEGVTGSTWAEHETWLGSQSS